MKAEEKYIVDLALEGALEKLSSSRLDQNVYGWRFKSAGCRVFNERFGPSWVKVNVASRQKHNDRLWNGELDSIQIKNFPKPSILTHLDWGDAEFIYRAFIYSLADSPVSKQPCLTIDFAPSEEWWVGLENALQALAKIKTDRVAIRDDLVFRRIKENFDLEIRLPIENTTTAHCDLHWANISAPKMEILDWEGWGIAPYGVDIAYLDIFSLSNPSVNNVLRTRYPDLFDDPAYSLSILYVGAEMMRMHAVYGMYGILQNHIKYRCAEALRIFKGLSGQ